MRAGGLMIVWVHSERQIQSPSRGRGRRGRRVEEVAGGDGYVVLSIFSMHKPLTICSARSSHTGCRLGDDRFNRALAVFSSFLHLHIRWHKRAFCFSRWWEWCSRYQEQGHMGSSGHEHGRCGNRGMMFETRNQVESPESGNDFAFPI